MKKVKGDDGHLKSDDDNECGGGVEYSECIGLNWVAPLASHLLNTIISIFIIISIINIISHRLESIIIVVISISISHLLSTTISIMSATSWKTLSESLSVTS